MNRLSAGLVGCALLVWASGAGAELYRCERPDGSTVFTDSRAQCPHATEHRPAADAVQHVGGPPAPSLRTPAPAAPSRASRFDAEAAEEARWRKKKSDATRELEFVAKRKNELSRYVGYCNRGADLYRERPNGLRENVSCDVVKTEAATLESREETLTEYLDRGLTDECRRSGCLPGWLR